VVACTLTGHGLKDPDIAIKQSMAPVIRSEATLNQVERAIRENLMILS
jgi:threonine synthase